MSIFSNRDISAEKPQKEELQLAGAEWRWPLLFMLSLVMIGLHFPLGYLGALVILINRFRNDKYDFVIMFTLMIGGYNLTTQSEFTMLLLHIITLICIIGLILLKKPPICRKIIYGFAAYFVILLLFALKSDETLWVQSIEMMNYMIIIYFVVPIMVFSGKEFDIKVFMRHVFVYSLIFCWFYAIDTYILNGFVLLPRDLSMLTYDMDSTFYDPVLHPFAMTFPRHWPMGLYIITLCVFPILYFYKLKRIHWLLIILALCACRTFSFIFALALGFILFQSNTKRVLAMLGIGVVGFVALYFVDDMLPKRYTTEEGYESTLRIQSTVQQFFDLSNATDDEDVAKMGTGRMAQALPKIEHLYNLDLEWWGFGFLSRVNTKNAKYIIENELYNNDEISEEVAIGVEIVPIQIFLTIGYLGLILHVMFYLYLCWCIRKLKYARYFYSMLVIFAIAGIGGFAGWIRPASLYLISMALAAVVMAQKRELGFSLPPERKQYAND